ncbi:uncharacterized protein FIBRA_06279 [Fibroporia radiculosa]|uniref:BING4 C-terminal domain-containing protein n=1 Tax=Fibroporia radiculosa TaxID=599839 RepID=J4GB09_9APHY|nr:uncharacterized protein FIBRA_06279 [Fibroporia radiculosa]CCM04118.1 predicted protein [Fibroporia radiculosa]
MTQNEHNAIIHLGHQNGTVTFWTPNLPFPAVRFLSHLGPVVSVSVDPSTGGTYVASAGQDGTVKVWDCRNWKGAVHLHNGFYIRFFLRDGLSASIPDTSDPTQTINVSENVLTIGHAAGLSSILVPGSGEPSFDSAEADPSENKKARREREIKSLLDKVQPDMITLDHQSIGSLAPPKLSTATEGLHDIPFSHLPRLERLRV